MTNGIDIVRTSAQITLRISNEAQRNSVDLPMIAAVESACFGGGIQLALRAAFRIADEKARFSIPTAPNWDGVRIND